MYHDLHITVIIPALNEESSIGQVVRDLNNLQENGKHIIDKIIVCDNGSEDLTSKAALHNGASVVVEESRGYGSACLRAIADVDKTDILLFVNADQSERICEVKTLLSYLINNNADLVIGSRMLGKREQRALSFHQKWGTQFASFLMSKIWGVVVTDLGPFRAIRYESYLELDMQDRNYGWTVEMQAKALSKRFNVLELPVSALKGTTPSRVTGHFSGVVFASLKIFYFIIVHALNHKKLTR